MHLCPGLAIVGAVNTLAFRRRLELVVVKGFDGFVIIIFEPRLTLPAPNGRSRARRLSQWEPAKLPLTNESPGEGQSCR